jgi:hypothetical protein
MEQPPGHTSARRRRAAQGVLLAVAIAAAGPGGGLDAPGARAGTEDIAATRAEVRQVQRQLNALGYDAGPVDGLYGQATRQAILQFERDHDLPTIGIPDAEVRERIAAALRRQRAEEAGDSGAEAGRDAETEAAVENGETNGKQAGGKQAGGDPGQATALAGTRWRLHHPQGQTIVLRFQQGGAIQAPAGTWRWERREDGRIVIRYDSGSRLTSRLIGEIEGPQRMTGWGRDTFGQRWQWSADRLDARSGS